MCSPIGSAICWQFSQTVRNRRLLYRHREKRFPLTISRPASSGAIGCIGVSPFDPTRRFKNINWSPIIKCRFNTIITHESKISAISNKITMDRANIVQGRPSLTIVVDRHNNRYGNMYIHCIAIINVRGTPLTWSRTVSENKLMSVHLFN